MNDRERGLIKNIRAIREDEIPLHNLVSFNLVDYYEFLRKV